MQNASSVLIVDKDPEGIIPVLGSFLFFTKIKDIRLM
jgi:hypothetical protein